MANKEKIDGPHKVDTKNVDDGAEDAGSKGKADGKGSLKQTGDKDAGEDKSAENKAVAAAQVPAGSKDLTAQEPGKDNKDKASKKLPKDLKEAIPDLGEGPNKSGPIEVFSDGPGRTVVVEHSDQYQAHLNQPNPVGMRLQEIANAAASNRQSVERHMLGQGQGGNAQFNADGSIQGVTTGVPGIGGASPELGMRVAAIEAHLGLGTGNEGGDKAEDKKDEDKADKKAVE